LSQSPDGSLAQTPLHALHLELGAKMVGFAGYDMPVHYPAGILAEHLHTRAEAGLFDVSHMGQITIHGDDRIRLIETLVPGDIASLEPGQIRYTLLTNPQAGILDDLMVTNAGDHLFLIVNASRKAEDFAHIESALKGRCEVNKLDDRALLALQGPSAAAVLSRCAPEAAAMPFMSSRTLSILGIECGVSRSGYTGEDGYEISAPAAQSVELARALLAQPGVKPIGLGARDSLRLEAGLCLHGSDIDEATTPIEAALAWTISKRRREQGGYPGADIVACQLTDGPARIRVGIRPLDKAPARAHTPILNADGAKIGEVTSGGFGPSLGGPLAMGYIDPAYKAPGTALVLEVRGVGRKAEVTRMPFVPHHYFKG
jgi:aminomethyltransferase